jgi:hypothetical protein
MQSLSAKSYDVKKLGKDSITSLAIINRLKLRIFHDQGLILQRIMRYSVNNFGN